MMNWRSLVLNPGTMLGLGDGLCPQTAIDLHVVYGSAAASPCLACLTLLCLSIQHACLVGLGITSRLWLHVTLL